MSTIPTIGFNVETVQHKNIKFQVWDLGGQTSIRPYWRCYYPNTQVRARVPRPPPRGRTPPPRRAGAMTLARLCPPQAIIYVIDSTDVDRLEDAKDEFHAILEEEELKDACILVYANKQDMPGAIDDAKVSEALGLPQIQSRQWAIFKTSAVKGTGLFEGLDWLSNALSTKR